MSIESERERFIRAYEIIRVLSDAYSTLPLHVYDIAEEEYTLDDIDDAVIRARQFMAETRIYSFHEVRYDDAGKQGKEQS